MYVYVNAHAKILQRECWHTFPTEKGLPVLELPFNLKKVLITLINVFNRNFTRLLK